MATIALDFDGTLAVWPQGVKPNYTDPYYAFTNAAAVPAAVKWLRHQIIQGHRAIIITGRGQEHIGSLRQWIYIFIGTSLTIHARPSDVGLSCLAQASWKAEVIRENGVELYVGDNPRIDEQAAEIAGCAYIDAAGFLRGELPATPGIQEP